jgi:hypothetical protein
MAYEVEYAACESRKLSGGRKDFANLSASFSCLEIYAQRVSVRAPIARRLPDPQSLKQTSLASMHRNLRFFGLGPVFPLLGIPPSPTDGVPVLAVSASAVSASAVASPAASAYNDREPT